MSYTKFPKITRKQLNGEIKKQKKFRRLFRQKCTSDINVKNIKIELALQNRRKKSYKYN